MGVVHLNMELYICIVEMKLTCSLIGVTAVFLVVFFLGFVFLNVSLSGHRLICLFLSRFLDYCGKPDLSKDFVCSVVFLALFHILFLSAFLFNFSLSLSSG